MYAAAAAIIGFWALGSYFVETRHLDHLQATGVETTGVVWSLWKNRGRYGDGSCLVEVRFRLDGHTQEAQTHVSEEVFVRLTRGDKIKVKYLREDASKIWIVGEGNIWTPRLWLGGGGLGVAALLIFLAKRQQAGGY